MGGQHGPGDTMFAVRKTDGPCASYNGSAFLVVMYLVSREGDMGTSNRWRVRFRVLLRHWRGAPVTWLIIGGFAIIAATAIATN
jgi:hypothetical protein